MIKGTIQQEDITLLNIHAPNIGAPKYVKQILMDIKGKIDRNTVIVRTLTHHWLQWIDSSRPKINNKIVALNDTPDQMDIIDIFRAFHPKAAEYTYFSSAHGMFASVHHMLGHKTRLNKFKKIEIISNIFSDHNAIKLKINHKRTLKNTQRHGS